MVCILLKLQGRTRSNQVIHFGTCAEKRSRFMYDMKGCSGLSRMETNDLWLQPPTGTQGRGSNGIINTFQGGWHLFGDQAQFICYGKPSSLATLNYVKLHCHIYIQTVYFCVLQLVWKPRSEFRVIVQWCSSLETS